MKERYYEIVGDPYKRGMGPGVKLRWVPPIGYKTRLHRLPYNLIMMDWFAGIFNNGDELTFTGDWWAKEFKNKI